MKRPRHAELVCERCQAKFRVERLGWWLLSSYRILTKARQALHCAVTRERLARGEQVDDFDCAEQQNALDLAILRREI